MPRKTKPLPTITIGGVQPLPEPPGRTDDRAFERIGNRAAGDSFDIKKLEAQSHGTHERPRFRARDKAEVRTTTVHVRCEVLRGAMVYCAQRGVTLSAMTERLWEQLLDETDRRTG